MKKIKLDLKETKYEPIVPCNGMIIDSSQGKRLIVAGLDNKFIAIDLEAMDVADTSADTGLWCLKDPEAVVLGILTL